MHIDDIRTTNNFFTTKQIFHHDWLNWSASWVRIAAVVIFGISCSKKRLRKTLVLRDYPTWTAEDLRNEWSFFFTINANEGLNFPYKTSWRRRRSHKVHTHKNSRQNRLQSQDENFCYYHRVKLLNAFKSFLEKIESIQPIKKSWRQLHQIKFHGSLFWGR